MYLDKGIKKKLAGRIEIKKFMQYMRDSKDLWKFTLSRNLLQTVKISENISRVEIENCYSKVR